MTLRDRLLDAAAELTGAKGWNAVTMAAIAAGAQVSRQSVYNEFGSRAGVAQALVQREVQRFLAAVDARLAQPGPAPVRVGRAADAVFALADENPLLRSVLAGEAVDLLPLVTSETVVRVARERVAAGVPQADPLAVDVIVRVVLSHVVQPDVRRPDLREVTRRLVGD